MQHLDSVSNLWGRGEDKECLTFWCYHVIHEGENPLEFMWKDVFLVSKTLLDRSNVFIQRLGAFLLTHLMTLHVVTQCQCLWSSLMQCPVVDGTENLLLSRLWWLEFSSKFLRLPSVLRWSTFWTNSRTLRFYSFPVHTCVTNVTADGIFILFLLSFIWVRRMCMRRIAALSRPLELDVSGHCSIISWMSAIVLSIRCVIDANGKPCCMYWVIWSISSWMLSIFCLWQRLWTSFWMTFRGESCPSPEAL